MDTKLNVRLITTTRKLLLLATAIAAVISGCANAKVRNYTVPDLKLRVNVNFGVAYGSDTDKVRDIVLKTLKKMDNVLDDPEPAVHFLEMSDFSLDFIARVWVKDYQEAYSMKLQTTDEIYKALNREGINIPFPTHTVYTKKMD